MPKEYIHNRYFGQFTREVDSDGPAEGRQVALDDSSMKVGWSKEAEHVEVALVWGSDPDGAGDEFKARHMQLDRAGLNRLIRTLRKARDAAFGADA